MTWNWQQPDWPHFTWNRGRLATAEKEFLLGSGVFLGAIKHLGDDDRNQLTVEAMSTEALTTSENEGEILDRASVQSSIERQLGFNDFSWFDPGCSLELSLRVLPTCWN